MKILVACEMSGVVTRAFRDRGHEAYSCDILATLGNPDWHIQRDVKEVLEENDVYLWDMLIGFPPCTYLCNSGVRWLYRKDKTWNYSRWKNMREGAEFFRLLFNSGIPKICIENPVMHRYAKDIIGETFTQSVQPWQFGHGYCKRTCLWLKGLPNLKPSNIVDGRDQLIHKMPPSKDRAIKRSLTPVGLAEAMANQWG
jgi:hypothetical protein